MRSAAGMATVAAIMCLPFLFQVEAFAAPQPQQQPIKLNFYNNIGQN